MGQRFVPCAIALAGILIIAADDPAPGLNALGNVQSGLWRVRTLGTGGPPDQRICIGDSAALVQLRHGVATCSRFVIADGARDAIVHYSCPGAGWGRTALHVASGMQVEIETQGIADNAPFAFKAEARRTGDCAAGRAPR